MLEEVGDQTRWKTPGRLGRLFGADPRPGRIDTLKCGQTPSDLCLLVQGLAGGKHTRGGRKPNDQVSKPWRGGRSGEHRPHGSLTTSRGVRMLDRSKALKSGFTPMEQRFDPGFHRTEARTCGGSASTLCSVRQAAHRASLDFGRETVRLMLVGSFRVARADASQRSWRVGDWEETL
jgi:hypothetical protein